MTAKRPFCLTHKECETGKIRTIGFPIYTVFPDGRHAVSTDFRRIQDMRPGYGYPGIPDPNREILSPPTAASGMLTSKPVNQTHHLHLPDCPNSFDVENTANFKHWFNHLLVNPDGIRFIFLHRCIEKEKQGSGFKYTRMFTANPDGSDLRPVNSSGKISHFNWRDSSHIISFCKTDFNQ